MTSGLKSFKKFLDTIGTCFPGLNFPCLIGLSSTTKGNNSESILTKLVIVENRAGQPNPITFFLHFLIFKKFFKLIASL